MLPDRVSNPGPLTYESGALPIALRGPAPEKYPANSRRQGHLMTLTFLMNQTDKQMLSFRLLNAKKQKGAFF